MRKTITALLMLMSLNAFSQWRIKHIDEDELSETPECNAYIYEKETGAFWFHDIWEDHFTITSKEGIFKSTVTGTYQMVNTIIGLYDNNNKLYKKIKLMLDVKSGELNEIGTRRTSFMFRPQGQGKKSKEILKHLKETDGYIRIIAPLYGKNELDITVPNCKSVLR